MKTNRRPVTTLCVLLLIGLLSFGLSGCNNNAQPSNNEPKPSALTPDTGKSYFMHIGLVDATGKQILTLEEGMSKVQKTLSDLKLGATVWPAWGGFTNDAGQYCQNDTIVVFFIGEESQVSDLQKLWLEDLQVSSILVTAYDTQYGIVGGEV